ncbi:sensor histidine kinase [Gorillibacterium timonense]|uniref:sensor histidine kinase n=1 Tax=Gorillibacterium timonense TaxID=1689269 RepID=UPI00071CBC9C|nr:sensor histidine kinase [Gorillibacterium timonense]
MFNTSIRRKLMSLLLAATIIPIAISMALSNSYIKRAVTEKSITENQSLLSLGKNNILSYMNSVNRITLMAYNSINSPSSLFALIEKGQATPDSEAFDRANQMAIYSHMLNMYQSMKEILQIHLQFAGTDRLSYLLSRGFYRSGVESATSWPVGKEQDPAPFLEAAHLNRHYELDFNRRIPEAKVITLRRPIIRTPSDEVIAYLSLDIRMTELDKMCTELTPSPEEELYLVDRSRGIICSQNVPAGLSALEKEEQRKGVAASIEATWMDRAIATGEDSGYYTWTDDSFSGIILFDTLKTNYMDWIIIKRLPYSYLHENARTIRLINSFIIAASLIIVVIATLIISVSFTKPIKRLIGHISRVQTGHFNVSVPVQGKDEISILARRFNAMTETINDLINREYKLELANKTNQLKAMQAQINPHFLNNALQSIGTLALQSDAPKVYSLISAMARMMRYSMNTEETLVPLMAELEHVKAYLELQQQRFSERLQIVYEIDPESLYVPVPKMLVQPLAENYFKHGYEPQGGAGLLRITSRMEEEALIIQVEDDGAGMEREALQELIDRLHGKRAVLPGDGAEHIGLNNVAMRIRLYYGEAASLHLTSEKGHGFTVTITIPLQLNEGDAR